MKFNLFLILFLVICTTVTAQDIIGKWYMVNRSGLIEYSISDSSLSISKINSPLIQKEVKDVNNIRHYGVYSLKNSSVVIINEKDDSTKYRAITFFNVMPDKSIEIAMNAVDSTTRTIDKQLALRKQTSSQLIGFKLYNENYLPAIKKLTPVSEITSDDFNLFIERYVDLRKKFEDIPENMAGTKSYQLMIQSLVDIGYNPLLTADRMEEMFTRFMNRDDMKTLQERLK